MTLDEARASNTIVGAPDQLVDTSIDIEGSGNTVVFEPGIALVGSRITLRGDNALLYLCKPSYALHADISLGSNACLFIGENCFFHPTQHASIDVHDDSIVLLGNDLLVSIDVHIATTGPGQVLCVGDHSWFCHGASVRGSSRIAPNTILASRARLLDCQTTPFTCWGGENRKLLDNVLYSKMGLRLLDHHRLRQREELTESEAEDIERLGSLDLSRLADELRSCPAAELRCQLLADMRARARYERVAAPPPQRVAFFTQRLQRRLQSLLGDGNRIVGHYDDPDNTTRIEFSGHNNLMIVEPGVRLDQCLIKFRGNNGLLYLSSSGRAYRFIATIHHDSSLFFGHDNAFPARRTRPQFSPAEGRCIVVGNANGFGPNVWIRTSDQHAIYARDTRRRINPAESVVISHNTRIRQNSIVQKGAWVEEGTRSARNALILRSKTPHEGPLAALARGLTDTASPNARRKAVEAFARTNRVERNGSEKPC